MKRLAIIPARAGSKRILNKNIKYFCGKPMIHYILNTANESKLFNKIHVSTESSNVASVCEEIGITTDFLRPKELADDMTPIMPVLKYTLKKYLDMGEKFDEVWLLMACSPLVQSNDLIKASKVFLRRENKSKSLIAVTEYPAPIEWAFESDKHNNLTPVQPGAFLIRSQDIAPKFYDTGTFTIFPNDTVEVGENETDKNFISYILPRSSSIDIDTLDDWNFAEIIYKGMNR